MDIHTSDQRSPESSEIRNRNRETVIFVFIILIILLGSGLYYKYYYKGQGSASDVKLYYHLEEDGNNENDPTKISFFELNTSSDIPDKLLMQLEGRWSFHDTLSKDGLILATKTGSDKDLWIIKPDTKQITKIVQVALEKRIGGAKFSRSGNLIAYIIGYDPYLPNSTRPINENEFELRIIDVNSKRENTIFLEKTDSFYVGFSVLTFDKSETSILVVKGGGDAGMGFEEVIKINIESGKRESISSAILETFKESGSPTGLYNKSATKNVYKKPSIKRDEVLIAMGGIEECLKSLEEYKNDGEAIVLRDFDKGTEKEIYRNLSYSDNYCRNKVRRVDSIIWANDNNIIFSTPDGLYSLDTRTETDEAKMLFSFPPFHDPKTVERPSLLFSKGDYVAIDDNSFINLKTGKILGIGNKEKRLGRDRLRPLEL